MSESLDTAMPAGRMVLIVERVKAGLRNARAKGKRIGRPRVVVDARRIVALRVSGFSWSEIACESSDPEVNRN